MGDLTRPPQFTKAPVPKEKLQRALPTQKMTKAGANSPTNQPFASGASGSQSWQPSPAPTTAPATNSLSTSESRQSQAMASQTAQVGSQMNHRFESSQAPISSPLTRSPVTFQKPGNQATYQKQVAEGITQPTSASTSSQVPSQTQGIPGKTSQATRSKETVLVKETKAERSALPKNNQPQDPQVQRTSPLGKVESRSIELKGTQTTTKSISTQLSKDRSAGLSKDRSAGLEAKADQRGQSQLLKTDSVKVPSQAVGIQPLPGGKQAHVASPVSTSNTEGSLSPTVSEAGAGAESGVVQVDDKTKVDKPKKKRKKAKDPASPKAKAGRTVTGAVKQVATQNIEMIMSDHDGELADIVTARRKIRGAQANLRRAKTVAKASGKFTINRLDNLYGLGNRTYNLTRGRGFLRTPKEFSKPHQALQKLRSLRLRMTRSKTYKAARIASSPVRTILSNPLSLKSLAIIFALLLFLGLLSSSSPITQDEFDLNDAWLHMTKVDREKSTDKVDYWTNIDDVLFYMGYKYDDWTLKDELPGVKFVTGQSQLNKIWQKLNSNKDELKTMKDLCTKDKDFKLTAEELEEYQEYLDQIPEDGRYPNYFELENPFYTANHTNYGNPLKIIKRYGYKNKKEINQASTFQIAAANSLYAPMSGTIEVKGQDITIVTSDTQLTFKEVDTSRVKHGQEVLVGDIIGQVKAAGNQDIIYQKLKPGEESKPTWETVNVGFYLVEVEYAQTTSVMVDLDITGSTGNRGRDFHNAIKKLEPKATINGVSAALGNFDVESGINPKRAEGDYLNPPVGAGGANSTSWDDEAWLNIGGPAIYNGRYPNILRRGLGLGQWTDTSDGAVRHTLLLDYAKSKGKKWYDLSLQVDFMMNGDNPYYQRLLREIITSNESVDVLAVRFANLWEGNSGDKTAERIAAAQKWASYLKNASSGGSTGTSSKQVPAEYKDKLPWGLPTDKEILPGQGFPGNAYALGNCTWYVYNRFAAKGIGIYAYLGNANMWPASARARGYSVTTKPEVGTAIVFTGGIAGTSPEYGHVGMVEYVNSDGSFLISEMNFGGEYRMNWRTLTYQSGMYFIKP